MHQSDKDMAEQILVATEQLIADRGLQNLSMQKIAKQAKISAGTIYLYFESKDKLLEQLARRVFTLFNQELEKIMMKTYLILNNIEQCGGMFGIIY